MSEFIDPESLSPEAKAEFLRSEGIRLCRFKALNRANEKGRPYVVVDRGEQQEPYPNGRHRFVPRSLQSLTLEDGWEVVLIVEPRKRPKRGRRGGKKRAQKNTAADVAKPAED